MSLTEKNKQDIEELKDRVESLEGVLGKEWVSISDDESDDDEIDEEADEVEVDDDEDIQQLKDIINRLDAQAGYYATKQQLDEVAQLGRDNEQRLNVIGGQINDLETRVVAQMEADRDALIERIETLEDQLPRAHQPGGGKRRKKTRKRRRRTRRKR